MTNLLQSERLLKLKLQFFADNGNTGQTEQKENGENAEPGDNTETNLTPEQK
ncbi:hypothetical protein [Staphylococcus sp. EZ-P03]|uniref:hypothetical protein n=1 Tax=Staphylococcus sp. EZ-P03 TaxID=2282739 RepID=UPI0013C410DC|nr:hypothetical protein [Staphylococcus sp. EZ-P03]